MPSGFFDIESGPSAKFERPGDSVSGTITRPYSIRQATEFQSDKLKVDEQGRQVMMAVVELQTTVRDPSIANDDGIRILYAEKFGQRKAISDALKQSGADDLAVGGTLTVQYVRDDPSTKGSPLKVWAARYVPPAAGAGIISGLTDSAPVTAPQSTLPSQPQQPDLISAARAAQLKAAGEHVTTAQPTPVNGGGSDIQKIRELAAIGFDKGQIHEAMPTYSLDMIAALLNV